MLNSGEPSGQRPILTLPNPLLFFQQLKIVFTNRAFLFVVGIYLFAWLALQVTASIIPFYTTFWMGLDSYFLAALLVQGMAIFMMYFVNRISRRLGKQEMFYIGIGTWIIAQLALFFCATRTNRFPLSPLHCC